MPRGRQRQCFPGRVSSLAESRQSEPCNWHKNSESEETKNPPTQGGCGAQKPSHCEGELESVEWQVTVSEFRFQPWKGSRNLKPGTLNQTPDPRTSGFGF